MKKKGILALFLCVFILAGCAGRKDKTECKTIRVEKADYTDWPSLLTVEKAVPLEATSSSLVTMASKCMVRDGKIYFADFKLKSIFVFDMKGKFLFSCANVGNAKSEHADLWDFSLSEDGKAIEVLDEKGVASYDVNSGKFISRDKRVNKSASEYMGFLPLPDNGYLLYATARDHTISRMADDGNVEGLRKRKGYQMTYGHFFKSHDGILVSPDYGCFTIDAYSDGKLVPRYALDFGSQALPANLIGDDYASFDRTDALEQYFKVAIGVMENSKWLYASVIGPKHKRFVVLYNKKSEGVYAGPVDERFAVSFVDMDDSGIYGLVYPDMLPKDSPLLSAVEGSAGKSFSNPVLVKMKIHENR